MPSSTANSAAVSAANAGFANQLLAKARVEQVQQQEDLDVWGTGQILSGIGMMVGAVVWFGAGLLGGRIFFYPPILFVFGAVALINGISQKLSR